MSDHDELSTEESRRPPAPSPDSMRKQPCAPLRKRLRWRFSLRALLIVIALAGFAFAWVKSARLQGEAASALRASNPGVTIRYDRTAGGEAQLFARWPKLRKLLAVDYFSNVEAIELFYATDRELRLVARFPQLQELVLQRSIDLTDDGLAPLNRLARLKKLVLADAMMVGDNGLVQVAELLSLENLTLQVGSRATRAGVLQLARLGRLTRLEINCASPDAMQAAAELRRLMPDCQIQIGAGGEYL